MSGGNPPKEIQDIPHIQNYQATNNTERQTSMSVGYLTRTPQHREPHPYDINNSYLYPQPLMQHPNMPQQPPQSQRESYDRPAGGPSHPSSIQSTPSTASPHNAQTPRITLPPLSAITENQENQTDNSGALQTAQGAPVSPAQSSYPQSQSQPQQQPPPPQPSPPYAPRSGSQYESQQAPYSHPSRHLQPSPQLAHDQSRYSAGQIVPQQVPLPHQMPVGASVGSMQGAGQLGQFPSQSPAPGHFPQQSQYAYQQAQYPPQHMYGQYPPQQMPPQMPPGIPYQPAYATSHRQRPPQFSPYPPPPAGFPQQGAPQGWPQQDYIAQPLTPLNAHPQQQPYSPQMQQMQGPGGPMRRRTSSGLGPAQYPPPGEPPQPPPPPQSQLKPKRKRATSGQLRVLNSVFASTFFPSTELRIALGKELNMSPRTVQIWFQNKRQSWRAQKAKTEHGTSTQSTGHPGIQTSPPMLTAGGGSYSPHPLRQEQHFGSSPTHGRMPSTAEEGNREEGMENDEGGGWEALRQAQAANRDYRGMSTVDQDDDVGFEEGGHEHHRHR